MDIFVILFLIIAICIGVIYLCESGSSLPKKLVAAVVVLFLGFMLIGSCSSFLDDAGSSRDFTPTTAEEAASQYYYDSDGHIRMKN